MSPQPTKTIDSKWVRFRSACYLNGRGISWGTANDPIVPKQAIDHGKYSLNVDVLKAQETNLCDTNLDIIANNSLDHIFVGARENPPLKSMVSKLKLGGHCVIHAVPGDPTIIRDYLKDMGKWQEKDTYVRDGQFLGIWKLLNRSENGVLPPKPKAAKRACIARYGAIGDMIMISPLIRKLAEDGYEVTMNITPYCAEVLKHNPYVSNVVLQERDMIPNPDLGGYWQEWIPDYDKYINLSESIEGKLLKVEGRRDFYTTKEWRSQTCNDNYYDNTMRLGGYPDVVGTRGELYFSNSEQKEAKFVRNKYKDNFLIVWALKGSSHHKVYPLLAPVLSEWLETKPDVRVVLVGSPDDQKYQFDHPQVNCAAGRLGLRDVFCLSQYADLVVGPESAIINAASCFDVPKITFLTHSSHDNLCKYWVNDYCLPAESVCSPCHQLHYSLESCPLTSLEHQETGDKVGTFPICATSGITPDRLKARLNEVYNRYKA